MGSEDAKTMVQEGVPRPAFRAQLGTKAFVVVASSPQLGRLRIIGSTAVTIGRGKSCSVRLSDPTVSTVHCSITARPDGGCLIEDRGSTNGTTVNGRRIDGPVELRFGDRIRVGSTILRYYVEELPEKTG